MVDLNNTKERIKESKTIKGRYFNFLGYFFSLYCAYKIVMCTGEFFFGRNIFPMKFLVNIIFDRVGKKDPITLASEIICDRLGYKDINIMLWSQHISFIMVGVLGLLSKYNGISSCIRKLPNFCASGVCDNKSKSGNEYTRFTY